MISRSGTRKSSDANVLAAKQGFDFAQRPAGLSEVFRLPLRKMGVQDGFTDYVATQRSVFACVAAATHEPVQMNNPYQTPSETPLADATQPRRSAWVGYGCLLVAALVFLFLLALLVSFFSVEQRSPLPAPVIAPAPPNQASR